MLHTLQCSAAQGGSADGLVYNPLHKLLCARPLSPLDLVLTREPEGPALELTERHIVLPELPWIPADVTLNSEAGQLSLLAQHAHASAKGR